MLIAQILIDIQAKSLNQTYDYALPEGRGEDLVGCAVLVSFGRRQEVGFVCAVDDRDLDAKAVSRIKPIEDVLTDPLFTEDNVALARWISKRYLAPLVNCIRLFIVQGSVPRVVRGSGGTRVLEGPRTASVSERWVSAGPNIGDYTPRKNAYKQVQIMDLVRESDISVSELALLLGDVSSTLRSLAERGVVVIEERRRLREDPQGGPLEHASDGVVLTEGQAHALQSIHDAIDRRDGSAVLIDGVTGSGKTEVYIRAIRRVLDEGRSCIVLVPEIALTPQMVSRFRSRFGDAVALLHSRMSPGERFDQFEIIRSGRARVVIGPRSALFAPLEDVGLIVIDEEHETTYKQESSPRYVSRDVAKWMMEQQGGTLVLGSATPSIEALWRSHALADWTLAEMHERANGKHLPSIEVIDMTKEFRDGEKSIFSRPLRNAIREELQTGHKVVLLLNQRGFARFLLCRDCGFVPECVNCSTSLTFHETENALVCHHCGYSVGAPGRCPACESPYLRRFGVGTERAEAELRSFLDAEVGTAAVLEGEGGGEGFPIIRMDADTTSAKGAHKRLLESFATSEGAVLLGTQMIAKGLDFDDVTLVGVINADTQLHLPDFRSSERTFDLIEQVAGRAGRAELPGRVLVQTYEPESVAIEAAAHYDRERFLRTELPKRRALRYPPFVRMANVLIWGSDEDAVRSHAQEVRSSFARGIEGGGAAGLEISPASPCAFERIRSNHRWHFVVKGPQDCDISAVLLPLYEAIKPMGGVSMAVDIDPIDML